MGRDFSEDKIIISNARFSCSVGILEHEKITKQDIFIDLEIFTDIKKASENDDINNTIDYTKVHQLISDELKGTHINLIETIAERIAEKLLNKYDIEKIKIKVKKPSALSEKNVEYTAVEIVRG